jgi:hypothetical protein
MPAPPRMAAKDSKVHALVTIATEGEESDVDS